MSIKKDTRTIKEKIADYLMDNHRRLVSKAELLKLDSKFHCYSDTIARKARELGEKNPRIKVEHIKGFTYYRFIRN